MASYKAFLARIVLVVCALIGARSAMAQQPTPVDPPSQGRRVSGWMVDMLKYPSQQDMPPYPQAFGIRGDSSVIMGPGNSNVQSSNTATLLYGRAFLKIDEVGPYTIIIDGRLSGEYSYGRKCQIYARLSKGMIYKGSIGSETTDVAPVMNFDLSVGYYTFEFLISCNRLDVLKYEISIRGPSDMAARPPRPDELFVVMR